MLLLVLCSCSDVSSLGIFKVNSNITLTQNCVNVTYVNITNIYLSGSNPTSFLTSPKSMNLISNGYQTYYFINTSNIGTYIVSGICDQNGVNQAWSYDFTVTPNGQIFSLSQIYIYLFFFLVCLVILP